jgi:hypothetical protein
VKKYLTWAVLAFAFYMVVQFPDDSVRILTNTMGALGRLAEQSADFVRGVLNT